MKRLLVLSGLAVLIFPPAFAAFGGQPPLGPKDNLRRSFQPYDLAELNYLGVNYCENLLDLRVNALSFTHLNYDSNTSDGYNLHFPDDSARIIEFIAWKDQFSPVARVELARRMVKGLIAAHIPGSKAGCSWRGRAEDNNGN